MARDYWEVKTANGASDDLGNGQPIRTGQYYAVPRNGPDGEPRIGEAIGPENDRRDLEAKLIKRGVGHQELLN